MGKNAQRRRKTKTRRSVQLDKGMVALIDAQRSKFREKFGREMGPKDPIFFDPDADTPQLLDRERLDEGMLTCLRAAGAPPALIHATMRTGMLVTSENYHLWSEEDLTEWQDALDEYAELEKRGTSN
jgi:hypothetical protein